MSQTRPILLTVVASLLGYLGIGAVILAAVGPRAVGLGIRWEWVRGGALVYAITALTAAFGLWHQRPWAGRAYKLWVVGARFAGLTPTMSGEVRFPVWAAGSGIILIGAALWLLGAPIQRRLPAAV